MSILSNKSDLKNNVYIDTGDILDSVNYDQEKDSLITLVAPPDTPSLINREITFDKFPAIDIVGGGGYGAKLLPSLACLDTEALSTIGSTKIGTGKYIDCP